ncbi:MAG TPA: hypothetical protein P5117_04215 [Spirochaetia bacterium]|nr:hypothetical protein [Spirochaetales bacterium]HRY80950.1 hypothetical protein [Spirochaetia bacterium]HRZ88671.1 hypothetical protein [Spirochaetia bacterium]
MGSPEGRGRLEAGDQGKYTKGDGGLSNFPGHGSKVARLFGKAVKEVFEYGEGEGIAS